jgi:DNA-binding NarL/FixJ family response regulator
LKKQSFTVVLLDLLLEDGNGDELLDDLNRLRCPPKVAVISANLDAEVVTRFVGRTAAQVPKPCDNVVLVELVRRLANIGTVEDRIQSFKTKHNLTQRETDMVRHAIAGRDVRGTADYTGVAESTVACYWQRIFNKTQCHNQRQVVVLALTDGFQIPSEGVHSLAAAPSDASWPLSPRRAITCYVS